MGFGRDAARPDCGQPLNLAGVAPCVLSETVIASRGWSSLLTQGPDDCFSGLEHCFHGEVHHACSRTLGTWMFWVRIT